MRFRKTTPFVYRAWEHTTWGDSIVVTAFEDGKGTITGWLWRIPQKGDIILFKTKTGETLHTNVSNVRPCNDPKDMFFASIRLISVEEA